MRLDLMVEFLPGLSHTLGSVANTARQNTKQNQNRNPGKLGTTLGQGTESHEFLELSVDSETAQWSGLGPRDDAQSSQRSCIVRRSPDSAAETKTPQPVLFASSLPIQICASLPPGFESQPGLVGGWVGGEQ